MRIHPNPALLLFCGLLLFSGCHRAAATDSWGPVIELRDDSNFRPEGKPPGGWWVTPIHANLLPDGKVLITGWSRRDKTECKEGGTRKNGTTFILNPDSLAASPLSVHPIDEGGKGPDDVLYCSGHAPLSDGRVLFTGGSSYKNLGRPEQIETGLDYGRIYDPAGNSFKRIDAPMTGGPPGHEGIRWYPTMTRLPDSRILVTGGFSQCCSVSFANKSIEIFDEMKLSQGKPPWELVASDDDAPAELAPDFLDYPHVYLLPKAVITAQGAGYPLAITGAAGKIFLFRYAEGVKGRDRFLAPPKGSRPGGAAGATGALLPTGEILIAGGTDDPAAASRADFYNPGTDSWTSLDTGISRFHPAGVLLPDGTVLIVNGEAKPGYLGDRRRPQILDPVSHTVTTRPPWPDDANERGYHSFAVLLKDGRVLIGGGRVVPKAGIGCERPDLRIYSPAYLSRGPRPVLRASREPVGMKAGGDWIELSYTNGPPREKNGIVLMALGSTTHAFDQNQRFIPLPFKKPAEGSLRVGPPPDLTSAPPGNYLLFMVNDSGVPSVGLTVRIDETGPGRS